MAVVGMGVGVGSPATCSLRVAGSRAHPAKSVTLRARDEMVTANLCSTRLLSERKFLSMSPGPYANTNVRRSRGRSVTVRTTVEAAEAAGCRRRGLGRRHCSTVFGYLA